jgi:hypothetical protein
MAKKAKSTPRKRKSPPKEAKQDAPPLGTVSIPVQVELVVQNISPFDEFVIEWGCLGLSEEPDKITERSGNSYLLDPDRPITTSEEGLHMYFKPPLAGAGTDGFSLVCTYNEAVEARTAEKEEKDEDDDRTREQIEGERVTGTTKAEVA